MRIRTKIKRKINKTLNEKRKELIILTAFIIAVAIIGYTGKTEAYVGNEYDYKNPGISLRTTESRPILNETNDKKIEAIQLITDNPEIETQIRLIADKENFKWSDYLVKLAFCESRLMPECGQLNNEKCINKKNNSFDRGYFQISRKWHPEVTDEQAFNLEYATKWTMEMINKGQQHQWACNDIVLAQK